MIYWNDATEGQVQSPRVAWSRVRMRYRLGLRWRLCATKSSLSSDSWHSSVPRALYTSRAAYTCAHTNIRLQPRRRAKYTQTLKPTFHRFPRLRCCPNLPDVAEASEIGPNVHAHYFRFPRTIFLPVSQKTPIRTSSDEIGRVVRRVVWRVRFRRPRGSGNTSDEEIGACSHSVTTYGVFTRSSKRSAIYACMIDHERSRGCREGHRSFL